MRVLIYLIILITVLLSFSFSSGITFENYENDTYRIILRQQSDSIVDFIIINKNTHSELAYTLKLDIIEGEVPKRNPSVDYNRYNDDECLYQCDSTYSVYTDSIHISFALEVSSHKRMDLSIFNSRLQDYKDDDYTLVQQSTSCSSGATFENYENDTYRIILRQQSDSVVDFIIINKNTHSELAYPLKLDIIEGEVPERGLSVDINRYNEYLYQCDSTYSIHTDSIKIAFALEVSSHKRMDLSIRQSQLQNFKRGIHTLKRQTK